MISDAGKTTPDEGQSCVFPVDDGFGFQRSRVNKPLCVEASLRQNRRTSDPSASSFTLSEMLRPWRDMVAQPARIKLHGRSFTSSLAPVQIGVTRAFP